MRKGELTRRNIIRKSATIFNKKGYMTTSMNDIIQETNIQKGGIYRHFKDKEQLMAESFHFSTEIMQNHLKTSVLQHENATDRLMAFVEAFLELSEGEPIVGGCPIFNAAIEMDDLEGNALLPSINEAMDMMINWIVKIIEDGISNQELKQSVKPYDTAIYIVSTLEGGLVLDRLKNDEQLTKIISNNLKQYISMIATERQ
ncbi:TetR/AcrR family transcriptional regulator [Viridibacillus sp. FSL R5-0477]|uniref:TetR family transcriptional regulator n=1 Tax=Viridibacillus arenosi FSL R5-213 TaxID=1227360 RepID=W4F310_9BACL|nr:TetR/AcrR family transcriptional regulator [Viridibacillus arenosi]ETT86431.1 TetR family transcriptional regulator [Viridibacillus arenosi FSL R5-213]OMC91731.1 TetR family transcriptional regulator [Viridibacillus arenosi]